MPLEEPSTPPDRAELDQLLGEIRALRTLACPLLTAHVAAIIRQALPQAAWASFHTERGEANNYYVYTKYPYLYDATGKEIMYGFTQSHRMSTSLHDGCCGDLSLLFGPTTESTILGIDLVSNTSYDDIFAFSEAMKLKTKDSRGERPE